MAFRGLAGGREHAEVGEDARVLPIGAERLFDDGVQDAVAPDRRGTDVGQQGIGDAMPPAEVGEHVARVIADRRQPDTPRPQFIDPALQLDQLRAAVGSPVGRSKEDEHQPAITHERLERSGTSGLVGESEIGNALADLGTFLRDVNALARRRLPGRRSPGSPQHGGQRKSAHGNRRSRH